MSTATAMVTAGLCLTGVGVAAGGGAPGLVCLVIALLGFVSLLRTLSRLVIVYVTVVTITMVVAGRIVSANALLVPSAIPAPRDDLGAWVLVLDTMFRAAGRGRSVAACALRIMVLQAAFDTATPPIMQLATSLRALGILGLLLATLAMLTRRIRPATASASQPGVVAAHPTSRAVSPPVPAVRAGAAAVPTGGRGPSSATRRPALWPAWPTQRGATDAHPGRSGTATERDHAQKW